MHVLEFDSLGEGWDVTRLQNICGSLNKNLLTISAAWPVQIKFHASKFVLVGDEPYISYAISLLKKLYDFSLQPIEHEQIQLLVQSIQQNGFDVLTALSNLGPELHTRRGGIRGRTPNQIKYLDQILSTSVTFGVGPAGTGKTFLAVACAVDALERHEVQRIVLTRPAVEAGERLGFLPGDLAQKVDPYLRPLYDALFDLLGDDRVGKAFEKRQIEIAPLAFMRGRTLNNSFIILDEAQNTTKEQMKMFLTRLGFGSKAVITGDPTQVDLPKGIHSGLLHALDILKLVQGISLTKFTSYDVIRHPLVSRIVEAYEGN